MITKFTVEKFFSIPDNQDRLYCQLVMEL